jgi:hypothetical protein
MDDNNKELELEQPSPKSKPEKKNNNVYMKVYRKERKEEIKAAKELLKYAKNNKEFINNIKIVKEQQEKKKENINKQLDAIMDTIIQLKKQINDEL